MTDSQIVARWAELLNTTVENLMNGEFLFDRFESEEARSEAWSLIPEHREIRERLSILKKADRTPAEVGGGIPMYICPGKHNQADPLDRMKLILDHINLILPVLAEQDDIDLFPGLTSGFTVLRSDDTPPIPNKLEEVFYHATSMFSLDHLPKCDPYFMLREYAIYLTKDDRVATYVLWPCLIQREHFSEDPFRAGFDIWRTKTEFWLPSNDANSNIILMK